MAGLHLPGAHRSGDASILDPVGRAAAFAALHPVLERLVHAAGTDARLSLEAHRVLRAVTGTGPGHSLALADLAARSNTPKTRVPAALQELQTHGYLARLARVAPHLAAALPDHHPPGTGRSASTA